QIQRLAQNIEGIQRKVHLFVLCANHVPEKDSLLKRVSELAKRNQSRELSVVPLSFQDDRTIASLFHISDLTCTRSGGQTVMELMCAMRGEIWIHSEAKSRSSELSFEDLLKGIPGWESGNAL